MLVDGVWKEAARVDQRSLRVCPLGTHPRRWVRRIAVDSELVELDRVEEHRIGAPK